MKQILTILLLFVSFNVKADADFIRAMIDDMHDEEIQEIKNMNCDQEYTQWDVQCLGGDATMSVSKCQYWLKSLEVRCH